MVNLKENIRTSIKISAALELKKITRTALFILEKHVSQDEFVKIRKNLLDSMNNSIRTFEDKIDKTPLL